MSNEISENTQTSTTEAQQQINTFEYGDLYISCSCGSDKKIETAVKHGIKIMVLCNDTHDLKLVCDTCGNKLTLGFKPTPEQDIPVTKDEDITITNDNHTESTAEGDTTNVSEDTKPSEENI
jgi:hypothetical protein